MSNLIPFDATLQKPVIAIQEKEKDMIKDAISKWGDIARKNKEHKPISYIVERDRMLVEWLFNTGMRISDALSIRFHDINIRTETVTFIVQKRSRKKPFLHTISLDKSILFEIQRFKEMFLRKDDDYLFGIARSTVDANLKKYCEIAGLQKFSAHKFRHGMAMDELSKGVPDFVTSFRLAHSSTTVTNSTYRRMTSEIERKFLERKNVP